MTEAELQTGVIDCARLFGWRVAHFRPALTKHGWRTPVQADGAGFPDLVLTRPPRLLFVELKAGRGKVTDQQEAWLAALGDVPSVEVHVWRPDDWTTGRIDKALARAGTETA